MSRTNLAAQQDWAAQYGLRPSSAPRACTTWLARGRHGNDFDCCHLNTAWKDHPSAWLTPNGGRVLVVQPYGWPRGYFTMWRALRKNPQFFVRMARQDNGWHAPGRVTLIEIWETEAAYRAAIGVYK